jgi:hypothetical protein
LRPFIFQLPAASGRISDMRTTKKFTKGLIAERAGLANGEN